MPQHLSNELTILRQMVSEMLDLAIIQLNNSKSAFLNNDQELAAEISYRENRMDALELSIDYECEIILGLQNPVATDLRFVLAMLKANAELERIGDLANGIAKYTNDLDSPFNAGFIDKLQISQMFDLSISMLGDIRMSYINKDTTSARKVFKKDQTMNKINSLAPQIIIDYVTKEPSLVKQSLYLFSTIKKLERIGDLTKNIAEAIIFYLEAEVLKHKVNRS